MKTKRNVIKVAYWLMGPDGEFHRVPKEIYNGPLPEGWIGNKMSWRKYPDGAIFHDIRCFNVSLSDVLDVLKQGKFNLT